MRKVFQAENKQVQRPGGRCELPWFKEPQEDSMAKARGREVTMPECRAL